MSKTLKYNEDHRDQAKALVIEQFKRSRRFNDWLGAYIGQVQDLEDALWELYTQRGVDTAEGAQLDVLGIIVGQPRNGLDDTDYRTRIKVRIRLNKASGIADDIYAVFGLMLGNQIGAVSLQEAYPAGLIVQMNEYVDTSPSVLADILRESRSAGVDTSLVYMTSDDGTFECSSATAPETGSTTEGFVHATTGGWDEETVNIAPWRASVVAGGVLYAVASDGAFTSTVDGEVWDDDTTGLDLRSLAYDSARDRLIAVGFLASGYSDDNGANWTSTTLPADIWVCAHSDMLDVTVALPNSGFNSPQYSTNGGATWSAGSASGYGSSQFVGVAVGNGVFVGVGNEMVATSSDGIAWVRVAQAGKSLKCVRWIDAWGVFVAAAVGFIGTSPDGVTWTWVAAPASQFKAIAHSPALGRVVVVAQNAAPVYSDDSGASWNTGGAPASQEWSALEWLENVGLFVALSTNGTTRGAVSEDGGSSVLTTDGGKLAGVLQA